MASPEPIAVIGLDLKFPGDATNPSTFFDMLKAGGSALSGIPKDRFNLEAFYHPDPERAGALNVPKAHFLRENIAAFDAPFFSITPAEAAGMDPQQRGLLETAYRAFENDIIGSDTGVFVGCFTREYEAIQFKDPEVNLRYIATGTGTTMLANRLSYFYDLHGPSVTLDTACSSSLNACHLACTSLQQKESSMALVAGCNLFYNPDTVIPLTSLGFLSPDGKCYSFDHRANGYSRGEGFGVLVLKRVSDAIRAGDTIRAVIRGSSSNQDGKSPGITQPTAKAQMELIRAAYEKAGLDLDQTRYFEAHGTGTPVGDPIEASAIGGVFSKYRSKEDPMYVGAVKTNIGHLEGSAGIAGLLKAILVLERGIIPPNINFERPNPKIPVDEWGISFPTSSLAWPTNGLRRVSVNAFGYGGSNAHIVVDDALHFLASHGLVGKHRTVKYPTLELIHVAKSSNELLNHGNPSDDSSSELPTLKKQLNGNMEERMGDVNDKIKAYNDHINVRRKRIFVFSSFDEGGTERLANLFSDHLKKVTPLPISDEDAYLDDLSYTLASKRGVFPWKLCIAADSLSTLVTALDVKPSPIRSNTDPRLGLVFTGQGAQWHAMGRELLSYETFAESLKAAESYLHWLGCTWSLIDEFLKSDKMSSINKSEFSQPICTALQVALVDLLRNWSVKFSAVVGHSSGEIAAAYASGAISRESAWKIAYYRGELSSRLAKSSDGSMLAVGISCEAVQRYIDLILDQTQENTLVVACINSPCNVTVSGKSQSIDHLKAILDADSVMNRKLLVENAYHSPYMETIRDEYGDLIADIKPGDEALSVSFYSSLTGTSVPANELQNSDYWVKNLISPVLFSQALTSMCSKTATKRKLRSTTKASSITELLEVGPHAALSSPIREIKDRGPNPIDVAYESLLKRRSSAIESTISVACWLYGRGYNINLAAITQNTQGSLLVNLPSYPFNHSQSYWNESRLSKGYRFRKTVRHELLGAPVPDWNPHNAIWRNYIRLSENPWIKDHRITGSTIYPAAGMLVMAIEAASQVLDKTRKIKSFHLRDTKFSVALRIPLSATGIETHFLLRPVRDIPSTSTHTWHEFTLSSYENGEWRDHCRGFIVTEYEPETSTFGSGIEDAIFQQRCAQKINEVEALCTRQTSFRQLYEHLSTVGLDFGPCFQTMRSIKHSGSHDATTVIEAPDIASKMPYGYAQPCLIHPTTLDGILQSIILALTNGGREVNQVMVPSEIRELWISAVPEVKHQSIRLSVQAKFLGIRQAEASIICVENETGKPTTTVEGFTITQVARNKDSEHESIRGLCFNIDWKPDPSCLTQETAKTLVRHSLSSTEAMRMKNLIEDVEKLCFLYIKRCIDTAKPSAAIPNLELPHQKYFEWMQYQVERFNAGLIQHAQPDWLDQAKDDHYITNMEADLESSSPEGKLCVAVGRALADILSGRTDALELLFKDKLVENVYRRGAGAEIGYEKMNLYLDLLAHKNPHLKILEVGAGTGGATLPILQCLTSHGDGEVGTPRFSRYDFTDISFGFFEKAKEMLADFSDRMTFRPLNVEGNLVEQGFDKEQYDVVIAANVIHATTSLQATLCNVRKMIKPGGKLILYEMTNTHMIRTGFAFGLLPGWWLSEEEFRRWGPLASPQDWSMSLQRAGFSGVDIEFTDFSDEKSQLVSVIVATAPGEVTALSAGNDNIAIVLDKSSQLQGDISEVLQQLYQERFDTLPNLIDISEITNSDLRTCSCIFLADLEDPFLEYVSPERYVALQELISAASGLLWLTQGGGPSPRNAKADLVTGFARCMRAENPGLCFVTLSVDQVQPVNVVSKTILKVFDTYLQKSSGDITENTLFEKDGVIHIGRIIEANTMNEIIAARSLNQKAVDGLYNTGRPLALAIDSPGLLDTLQFKDDDIYDEPLGPEEVEVQVKATGLNLLDVMIALGQVVGDSFGQECAGLVTRVGDKARFKPGDRVCGLVKGSFKTLARASQYQWSKIPEELSFSSAAALPVVYCTAYYALHDIGRIQRGETILIHWGAGGLGQAAIQIALLAGAVVIVTVGSLKKRDFVRDHYCIPESHILASRDLSFSQGVMRLTNGRGVDIVLNSMSGQGLRSSWQCIAPFGRFVEVGKVDIYSSNSLPMNPFKKNASFSFIDIGLIATDNGHLFSRILDDVVRLVGDGCISAPKPLHIYSYSQIPEAFRAMQGGSHIGKFVLEPRDDDVVKIVPSQKPSYRFNENATYLITGGLGGLGRSIAKWMASRGAKNLILISRSGLDNPAAKELVAELGSLGVTVAAPRCDVSDEAQLRGVLDECSTCMPPIKGAILGAMVLKDAIFSNMSMEDYLTAVGPKVRGSWNVHNLLSKDLDFFILLSSASGIVGNRGQSNYCIGNTFQDALARHRVSQGLRAISIDLGMILSVGFAAENQDSMANLRQAGFNAMRENEFLALIESLCNPNLPPATPLACQIAIGIEIPESLRIKGIEEPAWMQDPLFNHLFGIRTSSSPSESSDKFEKDNVRYATLLAACTSEDEAADLITDAIVQKLSKALSTSAKDIDSQKPLHTYGVDSLVAVELRAWFLNEIGADMAVFDIMNGSSIRALATVAATRSSIVVQAAETA
ncbi:hypothetical protein DV738_g2743, partial [Chaetothyriales sp. CBS 135597]